MRPPAIEYNKIFYAHIINTGAVPITLTNVEVWVDDKKQQPIILDKSNPALTINNSEYTQLYINVKSIFPASSFVITKIKFDTECETIFDDITQPIDGWKEFTWTGERLANQ